MRHFRTTFAAFAFILATSLAGCNERSTEGRNSGEATPGAQVGANIPRPSANDTDAQLMAAAEPFENLTENAFTTDTKKLDDLVAKARASGVGASHFLSASEARVLANHVAAIETARNSGNRADLAIASVEGYRTLVSSAGDQLTVPRQVSLLDYAGFRYQADLKAVPVRWSDAISAIDFADSQWQQISASVSDLALRAGMNDALAGMRSASQGKDAKAAMSASTRELDLVDALERFFGHT